MSVIMEHGAPEIRRHRMDERLRASFPMPGNALEREEYLLRAGVTEIRSPARLQAWATLIGAIATALVTLARALR